MPEFCDKQFASKQIAKFDVKIAHQVNIALPDRMISKPRPVEQIPNALSSTMQLAFDTDVPAWLAT